MIMKLFVWEWDWVLTDYTDWMVCVLAEDFESAIKLIEKKDEWASRYIRNLTEYKIIEKPEAFICRWWW